MINNQKLIKELETQILELTKKKELLIKQQNMLHPNEKVNDFLERYEGKELLLKHKLDEQGTWEVKGEDPNCDLGGSHHQPLLGYFEGTLENVLIHAVTLPNFWTWGAGGSIKKVIAQLVTKV